MHQNLSGHHGRFLRIVGVLGLTGTLAIKSVFGQAQAPAPAAADVQKMAEFVITEVKAVPYQNGNMDVPRTSNDVQPYTMINQEAILESNAYDLNNFLKDQLTQNTVVQDYSQLRSEERRVGKECRSL